MLRHDGQGQEECNNQSTLNSGTGDMPNKNYMKTLDHTKISDIEFDGIDTEDYPDFCDAFIMSASHDGEPMTEEQLEEVNKDGGFVYESLMNHLY
jgi:hypothetical protein